MTLSTEMVVEAVGTRNGWRAIARQRNCWIAQAELWQPLLADLNAALGAPSLPCEGGNCPYSGDCRLRLERKDPNPPCPRQIRLDRQNVQPLLEQFWPNVAERARVAQDYVRSTGRDEKFWSTEIDKMTKQEV
jgi:hypothetical protein